MYVYICFQENSFPILGFLFPVSIMQGYIRKGLFEGGEVKEMKQ